MSGDYPDWTTLIHLIGADIMMPIDIQGAYIMMPVDIQAQYLTLEIDIVAQTIGNIDVNLAAADVESINVDIAAQTIGDITVSIDAQNIGISLQPNWQIGQGHGKSWALTGSTLAVGGTASDSYEVPAGKALYITEVTLACYATTEATRDTQTLGAVSIGGFYLGGNGGCHANLSTPIKYSAEETATFYVRNHSYHTMNYLALFWGYEVDV